jgi:outer membrane lipoprotein LolB
MRGHFARAAGSLLFLLAGCAVTPVAGPVLTVEQQQRYLGELHSWSFNGRVAVTVGSEGFNAGLAWRQQGDATRIRLSGPLGATAMLLRYEHGQLRIETGRGGVLEGAAATNELQRQLGLVPPLQALRYWMLGISAPDVAAGEEVRNPEGRLAALQQQGWQIRYDEYRSQNTRSGSVQLPRRLTAEREGMRMRLVVDRWHID